MKENLVGKILADRSIVHHIPQLKYEILEELALELGLDIVPDGGRDFKLCVKCCKVNMDDLQYVLIQLQTPVCVKLGHPIGGIPIIESDAPSYADIKIEN